MRESCLNCARKHLGQAAALIDESSLGYPTHRWRAIGHIAEAESELLVRYLSLAMEIREHRVAYIEDPGYIIPIDLLLQKLCDEEMSSP